MFDAQCDLAAIVDTLRDDPDRLLLDFVGDLRRDGSSWVSGRAIYASAAPALCTADK